jgi:iron-sulfur cluster assembly accessory protein
MTISEHPIVTVTDCALTELDEMVKNNQDHKGKALRIYVEGGGCSGLQYGMVFDDVRDNDFVYKYPTLDIVVDDFSANYIKGSELDFSSELVGGGFKFNNPNAVSSCGCGKSFAA